MWNQGGVTYSVSFTLSGWSLLFGAGRVLQDLLIPKAEWSGVAVTLPHWLEMTPADPLGFLGATEEWGEAIGTESEWS